MSSNRPRRQDQANTASAPTPSPRPVSTTASDDGSMGRGGGATSAPSRPTAACGRPACGYVFHPGGPLHGSIMYRHCIFCLSDLGGNEALESFPVGSRVAFDAWKGRLWAVCPKCARWNLAPIEERWEPVEEAEKRFRDARLRVHSETIGLAKLPDGTRLIRVGKGLPGELAAWRYGAQLQRRRRRALSVGGALGAGLVAYGGLAIAGVLGGAAGL